MLVRPPPAWGWDKVSQILHPIDLAVAYGIEQGFAVGLALLDIFAGTRV